MRGRKEEKCGKGREKKRFKKCKKAGMDGFRVRKVGKVGCGGWDRKGKEDGRRGERKGEEEKQQRRRG